MSLYPDNFSQSAFDRHYRQPEDVLPSDAAAVNAAQACYRECVEACVKLLKQHGFTYLTKKEISRTGFACGLEEMLEEAVSVEMGNLREEGFEEPIRGDDHHQFFDRMYALLKEAPHA